MCHHQNKDIHTGIGSEGKSLQWDNRPLQKKHFFDLWLFYPKLCIEILNALHGAMGRKQNESAGA